ncbi:MULTISPECIES: MFS transporter [unclassified Coleofasciculus]|uniref:MFS transporter n=1 Tax=unclassified Coleofasciculus TaxID=2692782 RepID=UPI0018812C82|nr:MULTISPECIES: MFS transporter [unclassified Coleofasciculus]MBE9129848.1 MFS transporter [Coleofasciculus sp. LEGE 07081]MBE9152296.1 MFS transporter [Coleofasciculus sp. LEGE 07092]
MLQIGEITLGISNPILWLAQVLVEPDIEERAETAAMVFSGPQFFIAVISGVVLAFAFQLLLTNLGVAVGISMAGGSSSHSDSHKDHKSESLGGTIRKIGFALGLGTLISVTISLFFACLLAVKLSLLISAGLGAIVGLVIWATYFSLLVWVSSTTVNSLVGSVINTATSSFQALWGTATAALGGAAAQRQVVNTAEAAAAAVSRELGSAVDPVSIRENLEDYVEALRPPQFDLNRIRQEFEDLLRDPRLQEIATSDRLRDVDRQTFVDLVSSRSDLSKQDVNRISDQLEGAWKKTISQLPSRDILSEFTDYLKSATQVQLVGPDFSEKLDGVIDEMRKRRQAQSSGGPVSQAMTTGVNSLIGLVMGRTDLSDIDVEKIVNQLKELRHHAGDQAGKIAAQMGSGTPEPSYSPIRADIEDYLLNKYSWQMKRETLEREFRDVIYDPEAEPDTVARELEQLNRADFADLLEQRGVFTQKRIQEISTWLDAIRLEALNTAIAAKERGAAMALMAEAEQYLLMTPKSEFTPEKIQLNFKPILQDSNTDYLHLSNRLAQFDRLTFERLLLQRSDMTPIEAEPIILELENARDRVLIEAQEQQEAARAKAEAQWLKVQSFLRDTGKDELNPQALERELKLLLDDPQAGLLLLRRRVERFDRDTLVQILNQRQDLSEEQINRILDRVESSWSRVRHTPQRLVGKAKEQYDQATVEIATYLRNTGKPELNPDGIRRDLTKLLENPKVGAKAIRHRLAEMDRDTVVQLLAQRQDMSEAEANRIVEDVLSSVRSILKTPRRLALRTQERVQNFQDAIADYLRSTDKEELNPEEIKRDVQLLINHPRAGMESLSDRLSHFDRSTIVALLSQREDISEQDVNRIADQMIGVRDQVVAQMRSVQQRIQGIIDGIFAKIRHYLNSMERPELNYDGIKRDMRTLFDDPQAGFEAMRDRLSQFDRDTLVAMLSSRQDISEADANRIIGQIERVRSSILQRAERLQTEAQMRLEEVKHQTQRQVEETRKAAATASWWLFFTALVSGIAAAGAGAIGVID